MVSNWSLRDSKSPQVSKTLLSILADLNYAVVWTVSTRFVISKSSSPCTNPCANPLVTVPRAPFTIGIIVTVFSIPLQGRGTYPSFRILSILLCDQPGQQSAQFCKFFFFFSGWLLLGLVVWLRSGDPFVSQNPREVCESPKSSKAPRLEPHNQFNVMSRTFVGGILHLYRDVVGLFYSPQLTGR